MNISCVIGNPFYERDFRSACRLHATARIRDDRAPARRTFQSRSGVLSREGKDGDEAQAVSERKSQSWSQLMIAAQSGDGMAYARLLHEILPDVRLIVHRHPVAADRAEAVVQDVLRALHRLRHTYDPARPFADWLAAICERRALAALRPAAAAHSLKRAVKKAVRPSPGLT
jgi:hypothetical protein